MNRIYNSKLFNPLFWHISNALRDPSIRYILVEGGSSAGKTHTMCQALLMDMYAYEYSTMVFRRFHVDIFDSVYKSFKTASRGIDFSDYYYFQQDHIKSNDDKASVRFRGLDDEENIKGMEDINVVYLNEFNQFSEKQWDQLKKRLRGKPNQKFICDWNPVSAELWQYKSYIDIDTWIDQPLFTDQKYSNLDAEYSFVRKNIKGDTLWIKTTYRDNYWVVGHPSGVGGFNDEHTLATYEFDRLHKPNQYRIYANGERGVIRTGGEFWKGFDETKHVRQLPVQDSVIHVSCDQNVIPYVTLSLWQVDVAEKELKQVAELPCISPNNNAVRSARVLCDYLKRIDYTNVIYIYGDPSGNSRSVVDENSASFYDKFIAEIKVNGFHVVNKVRKAHPAIAISASFINEIYEYNYAGWSILISDSCRKSIQDYTSVQEDKDGTMQKIKVKHKESGVTYEPIGHFSDAKRYIITTVLETEYNKFKSKKSNIFVT